MRLEGAGRQRDQHNKSDSEGVVAIDAGDDPIDASDPVADAGLDAAVSLTSCDALDVVLCDGFEGDFDGWSQQIAGGGLEVVSSPVFFGGGALRATTPAAGAHAYLQQAFAAIDSGSIYTRAYVYLPSTLLTPGRVELSNTGDTSGVHFHFSVDLNTPLMAVNNQELGGVELARDTWVCVEWRVDIAAAGSGEMFIDGQSAIALTGLDTNLTGGYSALDIGIFDTSPAEGGFEVYIDEVAMDTSPIGCL